MHTYVKVRSYIENLTTLQSIRPKVSFVNVTNLHRTKTPLFENQISHTSANSSTAPIQILYLNLHIFRELVNCTSLVTECILRTPLVFSYCLIVILQRHVHFKYRLFFFCEYYFIDTWIELEKFRVIYGCCAYIIREWGVRVWWRDRRKHWVPYEGQTTGTGTKDIIHSDHINRLLL